MDFWMVGNCTVLLWSILVTTLVIAVISRLRHGIFGYSGYAEMPAAGYPGIHDRCQNCEGGVFRNTKYLCQNGWLLNLQRQKFKCYPSGHKNVDSTL